MFCFVDICATHYPLLVLVARNISIHLAKLSCHQMNDPLLEEISIHKPSIWTTPTY
jgi:hypothetical protein